MYLIVIVLKYSTVVIVLSYFAPLLSLQAWIYQSHPIAYTARTTYLNIVYYIIRNISNSSISTSY